MKLIAMRSSMFLVNSSVLFPKTAIAPVGLLVRAHSALNCARGSWGCQEDEGTGEGMAHQTTGKPASRQDRAERDLISEEKAARVVAEHKEQYLVYTAGTYLPADILGRLRYGARTREDLPVVGDWVQIERFDDRALIQMILPRKSLLTRQSVHQRSEKQPLASNVDCAFVVQSLDRDFSINRFDRFLAICASAGIESVMVLNKADLVLPPERNSIKSRIETTHLGKRVLCTSIHLQDELDDIRGFIEQGKTYCFLGSSGVGKTTLINGLLGTDKLTTAEISDRTGRGRHTTRHRQLIFLDDGAAVIDTPGIREIGIADSGIGVDAVFDRTSSIAAGCHYADCSHTSEPGCAVLEAVEVRHRRKKGI